MLSLLANFVWLATSFYTPLLYLLGGIILFPLLPFLWPTIKFSFLPFGRELVSNSYLEQFRKADSEAKLIEETRVSLEGNFGDASKTVRFLANVVWLFSFGWMLALSHLFAALLSLCFVWTIIAIPNIAANLRMIPVAFRPFGRTIISTTVAKRLKDLEADAEMSKIIR